MTAADVSIVSDPVAQYAVVQSVAAFAQVPSSIIDVTLSVARRRLAGARAARSLTGGVEVIAEYSITVSSDCAAMQGMCNASAVVDSMSSVEASDMNARIATELISAGSSWTVTVTSFSEITIIDYTTTKTTITTLTTTTGTTTTMTTITTTTTLAIMILSMFPEVPSPCGSLVLSADVPRHVPVHTLEWSCNPSNTSICAALLQTASVGGLVPGTVELTQSQVAVAGANDAGSAGGDGRLSFSLYAVAFDVLNRTLATGEGSFAMDVTGGMSLVPVAGLREFTELDVSLRLQVTVDLCGGSSAVAVDVAWSWRQEGSEEWTDLDPTAGLPTTTLLLLATTLGGTGSYEVRAEALIEGAVVDGAAALFEVVLASIPPPEAALVAPTTASAGCDFQLDASGSSEPQDEALSFSWSCSGTTACEDLVAAASGDTLLVEGGSLDQGEYVFSVTVARVSDGAEGVAEVTVLLESAASPVVSMAQPPDQVSPQATLALTATSAVSGDCMAPEWKTWWLVPEPEGSGVAAMLQESQSDVSLSFAPPLPVSPGSYVLRLVLSESSGVSWQDLPDGAFAFDSAAFEVDAPPEGGVVSASPESGDAAITPFLLSSLYWVDDDLPLMHKFSWCSGGVAGNCSSEAAVFKTISAWSYEDRFQNMLFSSPGLVAVKAEVMDTLFSVSSALGELEVLEPAEAPSTEAILGLVSDIAATGNSFAILAAVEAVAPVGAGDSGLDAEVATTLLDALAGGGSLAEPSSEAVAATASAINTVINSASGTSADTGEAEPVDIGVASQAADLLISSVSAASTLEGGLADDPGTTSTILGALGTLLGSVAPVATTNATDDSADQSSEITEAQEALSEQLQTAVDAVGEALLVGVEQGESLTSSSDSLDLTVSKESLDDMAGSSTTFGSVTFPPLPELQLYRRDARSDDCGSVGLQFTEWKKNPISYLQGQAPHRATAATFGLSGDLDCCDVPEGSVQSMSMTICGQDVQLTNLQTPIKLQLQLPAASPAPAPQRRLGTEAEEAPKRRLTTLTQVRYCHWLNQSAAGDQWEDSDLSLVPAESTEDTLVCESTRLTKFFTGSYGYVTPPVFQLVCPDADISGTDALKAVGRGSWWYKRGALLMWLVLLVQIWLAFVAWKRQQRRADLHRSFNTLESAGSCAAARIESNSVNNSILEASGCSMNGLLLWLAATTLGIEASPDELDGLALRAAVRHMVHAKYLFLSCQTDIGLSQAKVWHLRIASAASIVDEQGAPQGKRNQQVSAAECSSMGEVNRRMGDAIDKAAQAFLRNPAAAVRDRIWTVFWASHPVSRATCYSIVTPWIYRALALACSVLLPLAACALYVAGSARRGGEPLCERKDVAERILRDMLPGVAAALLAKFVFWVLTGVHRRALVSSYVAFWMLRELVVILLLLGTLVGSSCYILAFLAGVTETDMDHWLVSCLAYFLVAWLLVPLAAALLWLGVATNLAGSDDYVERSANLLRENLGYARKRVSDDREPSFDAFAGDFPKPQMMPKGGMSGARVPEPPPTPPWGEAQRKRPPQEKPPQPPGLFAIEAARQGNNANFWRWVEDLNRFGEDPTTNLPTGVPAMPALRSSVQQATARGLLPMQPPPLSPPFAEDPPWRSPQSPSGGFAATWREGPIRKGPPPQAPPAPTTSPQVRRGAAAEKRDSPGPSPVRRKGPPPRNPPGLSDEEVPVTPPQGQPRPPPRRGGLGAPPSSSALPDLPGPRAAGRMQPPGFERPGLPELPGLTGSGDPTPELPGTAETGGKDGLEVWYTDNRELNAHTDGVAFRYSPNLADTDGRFLAHWGASVQGAVTDDGEWLRTDGGLYLPMRSGGKRVLFQAASPNGGRSQRPSPPPRR